MRQNSLFLGAQHLVGEETSCCYGIAVLREGSQLVPIQSQFIPLHFLTSYFF